MEFMLMFMVPRGAPAATEAGMAEMGAYAAELAAKGTLRRGAPLANDDAAAQIRLRDGEPFVTDGPFAEAKELVAGFWVVEVESREEAVAIAARTPHARTGVVEVRPFQFRKAYADTGRGLPFLFAFHVTPDLTDPDGTKLRAMLAHADGLAERGQLFETAPLVRSTPPARVAHLGGTPMPTDGPFAEAKELIGGYSLVRATDRTEAVALATNYPHVAWGMVEVREISFFDRVRCGANASATPACRTVNSC